MAHLEKDGLACKAGTSFQHDVGRGADEEVIRQRAHLEMTETGRLATVSALTTKNRESVQSTPSSPVFIASRQIQKAIQAYLLDHRIWSSG